MMRVRCARQRFRSALLEEPLDREPLGTHPRQVELRGPWARDDDEVDPPGKQVRTGPEALTAEALDPVSLHGAADPATHDQPEPRWARHPLGGHEEREVGGSYPAGRAIALRAHELCVLAESAIGAEGHEVRRAAPQGTAADAGPPTSCTGSERASCGPFGGDS